MRYRQKSKDLICALEPCRQKEKQVMRFRILLIAIAILIIPSMQAFASASIYHAAKRDIGKNPTGNKYLWCQDAVNRWLRKAGYKSTGSRSTSSILKHGSRVSRSQARTGDIIYTPRKRGGHTEVFGRWANKKKTAYYAVTGNSCGKRGKRYVCEVERSANRMYRVIRISKKVAKPVVKKAKKVRFKWQRKRKASRGVAARHYTRNRRN